MPAADNSAPAAAALSRSGAAGMVVKVAVSVGMLAWIVAYADWSAVQARLAGASWGWLAVGFAVKTLTIPMAALRWRSVAASVGARFGGLDALRVTMASLFLGQALPGAVGGDIVRGWLTVRLGFPVSATMLALVADRVAALLGVTILMLAGLPHLAAAAPPGVEAVVIAAAVAVCGGAAALLFADRLPLPTVLRRPSVVGLLDLIAQMRRGLKRGGGAALAWSVGVHVCTIVAAWCFARAVGVPASLADCLAVVPFSIIAAALPVSLAGWGVREGSFAAGFALLGLAAEGAFAVSLLIGVSVLLMSLPGALVWLAWGRPAATIRNSAMKTPP